MDDVYINSENRKLTVSKALLTIECSINLIEIFDLYSAATRHHL